MPGIGPLTKPCRRGGESTTASPVIAISGPDNVGKSTQLRILARRMHQQARMSGPLSQHDARWLGIPAGGLASWWFGDASITELADVLAASYLARHAAISPDGIALLDRGIPMLIASLAATLSVRLDLDDDASLKEAQRLLGPYRQEIDACAQREVGVALLHCLDARESAVRSLAREAEVNETYCRYQYHLAAQIQRQAESHEYARVIVVGERPIVAVQDEIRGVLRDLGVRCPAGGLSRARVVALGGLSESGKSTAADWLRRRHGFARAKIGYLLENAAALHGIADIYDLDETSQAELLVDSLDRYLDAHGFVDRITIESLHRYQATLALRTLLGPGLTVVYIETRKELRVERGAEPPATIAARDLIKRARGADRIREIADVRLGNDDSVLRLCHQLDGLAVRLTWPDAAPLVVPSSELGLPQPVAIHISRFVSDVTALPTVHLVAVTGSGGRGKFQQGWSDLDVLVIADRTAWAGVREAASRLRNGLLGTKLGLTLISMKECRSGALTPRLVHTMRQFGTGELPVQWCAPGLRLPYPPRADDAAISLADGVLAAVELRRQILQPAYEARPVFKLAALMAKVMLRFTNQDGADDETALQTVTTAVASARVSADARNNEEDARELASVILDAWLTTFPDAGMASCGTS